MWWNLKAMQPDFLERAFRHVVQAQVVHPFPSRWPSSDAFHYARTMCMTKLHHWTTDLWGFLFFFADVRSQLERSRRCFATGLQMRKRRQRVVRRLLFFSRRSEWGGSGPENASLSRLPHPPSTLLPPGTVRLAAETKKSMWICGVLGSGAIVPGLRLLISTRCFHVYNLAVSVTGLLGNTGRRSLECLAACWVNIPCGRTVLGCTVTLGRSKQAKMQWSSWMEAGVVMS